MWKRWRTEYARALRERHDVTQKKQCYPELGEVVLVVSVGKNKYEWRHGQDQEDWQRWKHARALQDLQKTTNDFKY